MKILILSFLTFLLSFRSDLPQNKTTVAKNNFNQCIIVQDSGKNRSGQSAISFYNACNERLYINACVVDSWGDNKLYKSGSAIQVGGRYTIYTMPFTRADQVQWVADTVDPKNALACEKK